MIKFFKKTSRTLITIFPFLRGVGLFLKRIFRSLGNSYVEDDFNVINYFPKNQNLVFLDIGGNRGDIIDVIIRKRENYKIYSFEPNPDIFQSTKSRFRSNQRVELFNFGLGDKQGFFKLYIPVYQGYVFDGLGSLSPHFDDSWLSSKLFFYNKKYLVMREVVCEIKRLDDLNLEPFFMKIDVEGAELNVIKGGEQTISNSHPIILIESGNTDSEILNFLNKFGYKMYRYADSAFIEGERGSPNTFFITDEKLQLIFNGRKR